MTKAEQRKILIQYRDSIKGKKYDPNDMDANTELYILLSNAKCLDYDYADHIRKGTSGSTRARDIFDNTIGDVDTFTFSECCAYLTMIVRADRFEGGWYERYLNDGSIYKLLNRLLEVM